jgi:hypothetical protein
MSKKSKKNAVPAAPGRPQFTLKYPQSAFTVAELFAKNSKANGGSVKSALCIRQHIDRGIADKTVVQLDRSIRAGTAGRPKLVYALESVATRNKWAVTLDGKLTKTEKPVKAKTAPKVKAVKRVRKAKTETVPVVDVPAVETPVTPVVEMPVAVVETPVVETQTAAVEAPVAS